MKEILVNSCRECPYGKIRIDKNLINGKPRFNFFCRKLSPEGGRRIFCWRYIDEFMAELEHIYSGCPLKDVKEE